MRYLLFGASMLYLLGLKLTSQIEITPVFHHKTVPAKTVNSSINQEPALEIKSTEVKADTLESEKATSGKETAPVTSVHEK